MDRLGGVLHHRQSLSRTVSYTVLAVILAAVYVAGILAVQATLPASGDLAVAATTLTAAALFAPLRRGVQDAVDRGFNRSRHNSERTIDSFSERLRDELDLWLRKPTALGGGGTSSPWM